MKKFDLIRVKYFFFCLKNRSGFSHGEFIKKHNCFESIGEKCFFQPYNLPADSKLIRFGNNVVVASGAVFVCHDVIHHMLNNQQGGGENYRTYWNVIEVKDNCFIGANTTILPGVTIGPNAVVASGAVVNKDIPEGTVVAGVPAREIGKLDDLCHKREEYSKNEYSSFEKNKMIEYLWEMHDLKEKV